MKKKLKNNNNLNRIIAMNTEKTFSIKLALVSLFMFISATIMAQVTVSGSVIDMQGEPITGATIRESGTRSATITDGDGKFAINVQDANAVLNVSFIGYQTQSVRIAGRKLVTITLEDDETALKDIVIVGYGTMKKNDLTGAVAVVDTKEMMKKVPTNIAQALQGMAAGVYVSQQDGAPDANSQIRIRGVGTVYGSPQPLYVVDGVKVGTNANYINPGDVETIEILKDASATAIYGSEGANGVIMITTKHGQAGRTQVQFNVDFSVGTLPYKLDVIGVDDLARAIRKARQNDNAGLANKIWEEQYDGQRTSIDWQDQMIQSAIKQQYALSVLGGNEKTQYNFSLNYLDHKGLVVNTGYDRFTGRVGVKSNLTDFIEVGGDINFSRTRSYGSNLGVGNNINLSSFRDIAYMTPTLDYIYTSNGKERYVHVNVVNPDGSYGYSNSSSTNGWEGNTVAMGNVYATQMENNRIDTENRFSASAYADIKFFKGLNYHIIGSYSHSDTGMDDFAGGRTRYNYIDGKLTAIPYFSDNRYTLNLSLGQGTKYSLEHYLTYKLDAGAHSLSLMAGNTISGSNGRWANANGTDYYSADIRQTSMAIDQVSRSGYGGFSSESRMISYYGRAVYSLYDQLILTGTIRRDGSSNFSPSKRFGTFPSAAAAWRIKDTFLENVDAISNLKVRAGWGVTGNSGNMAGKFIYALTNADVRYNFYSAGSGLGNGSASAGFYAPLVDTNLKWEENEQLNFGLDLGFLDGDLDISVDYFIRKTDDLLVYRPIRQSSGYSSIYTNYGAIENKGLEFSVSYKKYLGNDFSLSANFTGSTISNKVTDMPDIPMYAEATGGNSVYTAYGNVGDIVGDHSNTLQVDGNAQWNNHSITTVGYAVGSYYGWKTAGIFKSQQELEDYCQRDASGSPILDGNGNRILIQPNAHVGDYKFVDTNGDYILDEKDRVVLGNGFPKFNFGLNLALNYKNWDFSVYTYGELGKEILSYSAMRLSLITVSDDNTTGAVLKSAFNDVFDPVTNPNGSLPIYTFASTNKSQRVSDAWIKKADFLRISNVQIGYTLNDRMLKALHMQSARVYVAVQNLATISPYTKYGDPENGQGSVLFTGLDTGRYPMARTYMLGLNVAF